MSKVKQCDLKSDGLLFDIGRWVGLCIGNSGHIIQTSHIANRFFPNLVIGNGHFNIGFGISLYSSTFNRATPLGMQGIRTSISKLGHSGSIYANHKNFHIATSDEPNRTAGNIFKRVSFLGM